MWFLIIILAAIGGIWGYVKLTGKVPCGCKDKV